MTGRHAAIAILALAAGVPAHADVWHAGVPVTEAERRADIAEKDRRIGKLLADRGLAAVVLTKSRNQAWLLSGSDTKIVRAQAESPVWLLAGRGGNHSLVSNNIECDRLLDEEGLRGLGWNALKFPWFAGAAGPDERLRLVREAVGGTVLGADAPVPGATDIGADLARIRFPLTVIESRRLRWLGREAAAAVAETCRTLKAGQTELEIGGALAARLETRGITPTVILVGADERVRRFRHLTPTTAKVAKLALVNLCAERWGLVVAVTRLVHFGPLPDDLARRMDACVAVDAAYLSAARPGTPFRDVFAKGAAAYAAAGFPEEWRQHHQGGSIGYFEREALIGPEADGTVVEGMALALNPTLAGVKVEDTFLVGPRTAEILTVTPGWPVRRAVTGGATWERPDILIRPVVPPAAR